MAIKPLIGRWGQGWIRNTQDLLLHGLDYFRGLPTWVQNKASLSFSAEGAEQQNDYEAGTLYFRDSNFNRVGATFSRTTTATRVNKQGLIESVAANVPRIDYTDGSAKLLLEPSRTNNLKFDLRIKNTNAQTFLGTENYGDVTFDKVTINNAGSHTLQFPSGQPAGTEYRASRHGEACQQTELRLALPGCIQHVQPPNQIFRQNTITIRTPPTSASRASLPPPGFVITCTSGAIEHQGVTSRL